MYKDVKKKLLAVVLCVCMVIGAIEVVPRVMASTEIDEEVVINGRNDVGDDVIYTLTVETESFKYNGEPQVPKIKEGTVRPVSPSGIETPIDISGWEFVPITLENGEPDDVTEVGPHTCELRTPTNWFSGVDTRVDYRIDKADIVLIEDTRNTPLVIWTSNGKVEGVQEVKIVINGSKPFILKPDQFEVTLGEAFDKETGKRNATLKITDKNHFELSDNAEKDDFEVFVAYDLNAKGDATKREMSIENDTADYTGTPLTPTITIYNDGTRSDKKEITDGNGFSVKYFDAAGKEVDEIINAGTYKVEVTPENNADYASFDGDYFTGKFEGEFKVTPKGNDELDVYAQDEKSKKPELVYTGGKTVKTLVYSYNNGNPVQLQGVHVYDTERDDLEIPLEDNFETRWDNDTGVGNAAMILSPLPGCNYEGDIYVQYFIASRLSLKLQFDGYDPDEKDELIFTGNPVIPDRIEVRPFGDENAAPFKEGEGYTVSYWYYDGNDWKKVEEDDDNLAFPGEKKVRVDGLGNYKGQWAEETYTVLAVDMSDGPDNEYADDFELKFGDDEVKGDAESGYYVYYKHEPWEPEVELTYREDSLTKDVDYTVSYGNNNENTGIVTVTVTAVPGSAYTGSRSISFEIKPISLKHAKMAKNEIPYTGNPIIPDVKLVNLGQYEYTLRPGDASYTYKADGDTLPQAPKEIGSYTVEITSKNANITDSKTLSYEIVQHDISNGDISFYLDPADVNDRNETEWTGTKNEPEVMNSNDLKPGIDYTVEYKNSDQPWTASSVSASAIITGQGNYMGTQTLPYTITPRVFTDAEGEFDFAVKSSGEVGNYTITLTLKDLKRSSDQQDLDAGEKKDYNIKEVWLQDIDNDGEWTRLTKDGDYTVAGNTITDLNKAGKYRVTIAASTDKPYKYTGTLSKEVDCGIDISDMLVRWTDPKDSVFTYDGDSQKPEKYELVDSEGNAFDPAIDSSDGDDNSPFTVQCIRYDKRKPVDVAAGDIFLYAVGNPDKGYFGKTTPKTEATAENKGYYYTIRPAKWSSGTLVVTLNPSGSALRYAPDGDQRYGGTPVPDITVKFGNEELIEGEDYELPAYYPDGDELQSVGHKRIKITGIGNYEGSTDFVEYDVLEADIDSEKVSFLPKSLSYSDIYDYGKVQLSQGGYELVPYNSEAPDDYYDYDISLLRNEENDSVLWKGKDAGELGLEDFTADDGALFVVYLVTGNGNYTGTRKVPVLVKTVDLGKAKFVAEADAQPGDYYVHWAGPGDQSINKDDLKEPFGDREQVKPEEFTIYYKTTSGTVPLVRVRDGDEQGKDYKILEEEYGTNKEPGNSDANYVTIQGVNGYTGTKTLNFTIYTPIDDAVPTAASLVSDGAIITKQDWNKAYEAYVSGKGDALVQLAPLCFDETGQINPDEYTLTIPDKLTSGNPEVGQYTITVNGAQSESHFYYGRIDFHITLVDGVEGADITINSDDTASYRGNGHEIKVGRESEYGDRITVKVGDLVLTEGTDYEIDSYASNAEIGKASVTISGKGKFRGTETHDFYITYPIKDLVVYMHDSASEEWVNLSVRQPEYPYTGEEIEPEVKIYCKVDKPESGDYIDDGETVPETKYDLGWNKNLNVGTADVIIKGKKEGERMPYFVDGTSDPRRTMHFKITSRSILPAEEGGDVDYSARDDVDLQSITVEYKGEDYKADELVNELGIGLRDNGRDLVPNKDYRATIIGEKKNVSATGASPSIEFIGIGPNYTGTYKIPFRILPKDIEAPQVTAEQVVAQYTDDDPEQSILDKLKLALETPSGKLLGLDLDTDYVIDGYYTDASCVPETAVKPDMGVGSKKGDFYAPQMLGEYFVRIKGKGNFSGTRVAGITIIERDLTGQLEIAFVDGSDCHVDGSGMPDCVYNAKKHEPSVEVSYSYGTNKVKKFTLGKDYTVEYSNNVNASTVDAMAKVTVTMEGSNYSGTAEREFAIKPKDIAGEGMLFLYGDEEFVDGMELPWNGTNPQRPDVAVRDRDLETELAIGEDYILSYFDDNEDDNTQTYAGEVTMTITGQGNYGGEKKFTYYIGENLGDIWALVDGKKNASVEYNGLSQAPAASRISVGGSSEKLTDENGKPRYKFAFYKGDFDTKIDPVENPEAMVDAGTYYVSVVGIPEQGTYAKTTPENSCVFTIEPRSINQSYIMVSGYADTYYYTGSPINPSGITVEDTRLPSADGGNRSVILAANADYTVDYSSGNCTDPGEAEFYIEGEGNYTGKKPVRFTILGSGGSGSTGTGSAGGSYEGSGSMTDGSRTISPSDVTLRFENSAYGCMMYNGRPRTPSVSISGLSSNNYAVTASDNVNPGRAMITITGRGNYSGTITMYYDIRADLSRYGRISATGGQTYSAYELVPGAIVTCAGSLLTEGVDYELSYTNGTDGMATLTATALADSFYIGSVSTRPGSVNSPGGLQVTGYSSSYTYTGYPITPELIVTMDGNLLNRGTDYIVTYSNNINVGTASMLVDLIGEYSGSRTITFTIEPKNIGNCQTTPVDDKDYDGSTYTPGVTVTDSMTGKTLSAGTDYTVTYSNNKNPGTGTITVKALSKNYTGTKVIPFKIKSAAVSGLRASKIKNNRLKLAWSDQDYADGYQICNSKNKVVATTKKNSYTVKGLKACTAYKFKVRSYVENADGSRSYGDFSTAVSARTKLNTPKLKAKSVKHGTVSLSWNKVSKATGYEIYYSTKKNGVYTRLKTIHKASKRSYTDTGLARGEKYYYTIRAYRTVNGTKTYSGYNTIKAVRVK